MIAFDELLALPGGQLDSAQRHRVLLGILADDHARRLGIAVAQEELHAAADWFRKRFRMSRQADVLEFLAFTGSDLRELTLQLRTFVNTALMQQRFQGQIDGLLPHYRVFAELEARRVHCR